MGTKVVPSLMVQHIDIFVCPVCGGALNLSGDRCGMECSKCYRAFRCEKGIPLLFWPNEWDDKIDVTEAVKLFYEKNPFPDYEDTDSKCSLRERAEKGIFVSLLAEQIPQQARILEVGCGTGQLGNFLAMTGERSVFATDICLNSLKLGQKFKEQNQIDRVAFLQMNLFRPVFRPGSFDLIICYGVLHHTSNPFAGFQTIARLVKNHGFIIIGLYNAYGRIPARIRRLIFRLSGNHFRFLDACLRTKNLSPTKKHAWFMDQYKNPQESRHTIGEVLSWFEESGVEFINSIPKCIAFESFSPQEKLFKQNPKGTWFGHFLVQLGMLFRGGRQGGFFIMIGRKKG